ncbi:hypothetical protein PV325_013289 [Microctonus aethiopoides]|nr:hypothetical protein PV325_013289 [Microctonus aethiopoides]
MNTSRVYPWMILIVILFSLSFSQKVEFHELIGALNKIAISTESKSCKNNEQCLKIQQCLDKICVDPCPGSCGIDALCYTINHTLLCECPRCYYGDPNDKCQSFTEALDPSKECENSTSCGMSEKCILDLCRNPCPGSCGINAICTVLKHEPNCRCPKCYEGDALIKCEPYQGLRRFTCQWGKLIKRFSTILLKNKQ